MKVWKIRKSQVQHLRSRHSFWPQDAIEPTDLVRAIRKELAHFSHTRVYVASLAFAFTLAFLATPRLSAQTSGTVSGHVSDATSASLPDANITIKNVATGAERTTVTTGAGDYTFANVPVGVYAISAKHTGFKTSSSARVEVQVQQSVRLDFSLQLGDVMQSVEVEASGTLLQADNGTLGTVIDNKTVTELPLNGRDYLGLVTLSSNVNTLSPSAGQASGRLGGDRASQSIAVGGQRIMFDYYTLDGMNNTDPDFNTYIALPSIDGIQEFKVQTGVYSAEYGHEASQINVVSKGGTNTYHGALYEFIRNSYVDAIPYSMPYNTTRNSLNPYKWNDYGFELDGPIRIPKLYNGRDKFFFMVDDEWRKIRLENPNNFATVPTAAQQGGDFSSYAAKIYDPATGDANGLGKQQISCNGVLNVICPARIDPISQKLLAYYAVGATQTDGTSTNYKYSTKQPQNRQSLTVRGDYYQSAKSQYSFRYSAGNEDITSTGLKGAGSKIVTNYYQYLGSNTYTLTPHIVNEARVGYSSFFNSLGLLSAYTTDVVGGLQIPGLNGGASSTWGIPDITFGSGTGTTKNFWSNFGDTQDGPYVINDPMWQIVDNLSWVKGKHSLRFGFEYNHQIFNQLGNQFSRGQFNFQPNATALVSGTPGHTTLSQGDAFAEFLLGDIQFSTVAVSVADANYVRNVEAAYVEDNYKLTPKFTISAGLRYELTPPWVDTVGNNFTVKIPVMPVSGTVRGTIPQNQWPYFVRQGNCSDAYHGLSINWTDSTGKAGTTANPPPVCSNGTLPDALMNTQYNNWAPRLTFAYSATPTLVVRAGFGIFYNQDTANAYFDMARNIAGRVTLTADTNKPQGTPDLFYSNAVPGGAGAIAQIPPPYAFASAISHKTSYTEQFLLNLQKEVGRDWAFEAGYLGALSRHLYGFTNANAATPYGYIGNGAQTTTASRTPFPNYGVIQLVHDAGMANYNSLSLKATRRFRNGFNLIGSYTYSKSLDDTSGIRSQGNDQLFPMNRYCISCDYGRSAFDVRHRIVVSVLYDLPIGPGKLVPVKGVMNALIGGWQIGSIITHQTGAPGTILYGSDNSLIGTADCACDRPNATGISPYLSGSARSLSRWLNPAAYAKAPGGTFGNVSRGSYTVPGVTNMDASLHKSFQMPYSEEHQLSIRFEAFNALNHPNWQAPNLRFTSATFGRIPGAQSMRQLQLAIKYHF